AHARQAQGSRSGTPHYKGLLPRKIHSLVDCSSHSWGSLQSRDDPWLPGLVTPAGTKLMQELLKRGLLVTGPKGALWRCWPISGSVTSNGMPSCTSNHCVRYHTDQL